MPRVQFEYVSAKMSIWEMCLHRFHDISGSAMTVLSKEADVDTESVLRNGAVSKIEVVPELLSGGKLTAISRTPSFHAYPPARNARAALRMAGATASISFSRISRSGTLSPSSGFTPVSQACTTAGESCSLKVRAT